MGIRTPGLLQLLRTAGQSHPTERLVPYCRGPLVESNIKPRERLRSTPGWSCQPPQPSTDAVRDEDHALNLERATRDTDPATARRMIYAWFHEVLSMIEPERRHMHMMALYTMVEAQWGVCPRLAPSSGIPLLSPCWVQHVRRPAVRKIVRFETRKIRSHRRSVALRSRHAS